MSNDCTKQIDSIWPYMCSLITHRTSKRGKNKEVRYEPQASSVCDVFSTFSLSLWVIRVHKHGEMESYIST